MADRSEHVAAFEQLAGELHAAATANARALRAHRDTPAAAAVERQLEHTLDRLALLYGRGTVENLSTVALFHTAIDSEIALAHERDTVAPGSAADHTARAQALVDAARRGVRLNVRPARPPFPRLRGVLVTPLRPAFELALRQRREPYMRWRDGVLVVLREAELDELRAAGDEIDVLFLDPDELLDLAGRNDQAAFDAEIERRLAVARASPERLGDSRERHLQRQLHRQSRLLRNLRDRLAGDHAGAHRALQPVIAQNRAILEAALVAAPPSRAALADPLTASIDHERAVQALVARWTAEPDEAGLLGRFQAVAAAGTHLPELERQRR